MANPTITGSGPNSRTNLQNIHSGERSFQKDLATTHSQVALMQSALTNQGYDTNGADGKFGDNTLSAVKAFQKAKGLTADGYFGKNSLLALESDIGGHLDPTSGGCTADGGSGSGGTTPPASGTYNPQEALKYAERWYAGNNPDFTWFGKNAQGQQSPIGGNGDCANFASQCLYAGGMPMKRTGVARDQWYYDTIGGSYNGKSSSWSGAHELRLFIKYNTGTPRFDYEFLSSANGLVPGDLVFVLDRSNGESKAGARATHVAMVRKVENGKVYIYSHTPYSNGEWDTSAANTLFCHFKGIVI